MNTCRNHWIVLALVSVVLLATEARTQNKSNFGTKGILEMGGTISFESRTAVFGGETVDDAANTFAGALYVGYFIIDGFELGVNPLSWRTISVGDASFSEFTFLVAPSYNFRTEGIAFPFVEGLMGFSTTSNGETESGFSWGARGGVKLAFVEHANIVFGIQYLQVTLNESGASERRGYNAIEGMIGFTVWP